MKPTLKSLVFRCSLGALLICAVPKLVLAADVYGTKSSTTVYHTRACSSGKRISADNRVTFASEQEAIDAGRRKCKLCARLDSGPVDDDDAPETGEAPAKPAKPVPPKPEPAKPDRTAPETPRKPANADKDAAEKPRATDKPTTPAGPGAKKTVAGVGVRIDEVICGDTLTTSTGSLVRILGVCCPEVEQPYGTSAKRHTSGLVMKQEVHLLPEAGADTPTDKSKRIVTYVIGKAGKNVTESLIASGLGWFDRDCKCARKSELMELEAAARAEKLGVWKPLRGAAGAQKVVTVADGHSYHDKDCVHLKRSKVKKELTVNEAKSEGYPPCAQWLPAPENASGEAAKKTPAKKP